MATETTLILGAVAYDPKVVSIWDGFQSYFSRNGLAFDYILYTNYERQVEAHFAGQIHVAWNSPLAWLQAERIAKLLGRRAEAIAMRDSDCDLSSLVITRANSGIREVNQLKGKRLAVGAQDSPQATLIPLECIAREGVEPGRDFEVVPFDILTGKHGDHIGGEREAAKALLSGKADAACMIDSNHLMFGREGIIPPGSTEVLLRTPLYDHCNFTILDGAPPELIERFRALLLGMSYADAEVRPLLDMEGLKQWREGRTIGYRLLDDAVSRFRTIDAFVDSVAARWK